MEARSSSVAPVIGLKRASVLLFPGGFEHLLFRCLARRSRYIRDQLDLVGEDGLLELPAELGSLWIEGLLSSRSGLLATTNIKLTEYLKAAQFFQDVDLIKKLCKLLAKRLFKSHGTSCDAPSCSSQAEQPDPVLNVLSEDHAIEVLRCSPSPFEAQLLQLSPSLRSLAAIAHVPSLGTAFSVVSDFSSLSPQLPVLCVCVDTTQAQADTRINLNATVVSSSSSQYASYVQNISAESMWPLAAEMNDENVESGLFSLQRRAGTVTCPLVARSRTLQNMTIALPDTSCFVMGSCSGDMHVEHVTFQGGAVVCMGTGCKATFDEAVFERCSLVVLAGAQVTLRSPHFRDMGSSQARISIYAHGAGTKVAVKGGTITGGTQGVTVQAGACFEAADLTISSVEESGVEVKHEGSSLELSGCKLHDFASPLERMSKVAAVHVHTRSSAQLSSLSITGMKYGVYVDHHASATLCECTVSDTVRSCVVFSGAATGTLDQCTLSGSQFERGLGVVEPGSCVRATRCHFLNCKDCGAQAAGGAALTADACTSSGIFLAGYAVRDAGSVMELTNCNSTGDYIGCSVLTGKLTANKVVVSGSEGTGFYVSAAGSAMLWGCTSTNCGEHGVAAGGEESSVELHSSTLQQNGLCGVIAHDGAVVEVRGCSSSGNEDAGYWAQSRMTVSSSSSDGDSCGYYVAADGQLTMEGLTVDGVVRSGHLP